MLQNEFLSKLNGFERLNSLNERATTKTLHVSLNFDPSEKLFNEKLVEVANAYMEKLVLASNHFCLQSMKMQGIRTFIL